MATVTDIQDYADASGNVIVGKPRACVSSFIEFAASNCRVEISDGVSFRNAKIKMTADNGLLRIGSRSTIKNTIRVGLDSSVIIGKRLSCTGSGILSAAEGTSVTIGDDCMFSVSFDIRSDHAHPIFDRSTGKRVNKSKSLVVGNHVWLGPQALIYPGAHVGDGSVIGARSLVSGIVPPHCIAVGVPARVTRRNIVWDKTHVCSKAPWRFNDLDDLGHIPWQSAVADIEPLPAIERRRTLRDWFNGIFAAAGCALIQIAPIPDIADRFASL